MTMTATMPRRAGAEMEGREFKLRNFLIASVLLHSLLFLSLLLTFGGIFGGPGPGGGEAVTFQLAAGSANDRYAAPPEPVQKPEPPKPEPVKPPEPKKETVVRKDAKPIPPPEVIPEPAPDASQPAANAGGGIPSGTSSGAGGDAAETILNKKGDSLNAGQIRTQMVGKTFHLEMGRIEMEGGNRLINTIIKLHPNGTTDIELIQYFFQTYHRASSSTRSRRGDGTWWIEGNRWCHRSEEIQYNTRDCYDMTKEGNVVRLYYGPCTAESSQLCKTGRIAAEGEIR
ncbi:hypothetical protein [Parvibaculum sp.]|uniref:hypothetical protein n=1 Tax=Parvibaculum sp. TaxID=2024848 RepID=UPI00273178BD|nr:hypothetical protein [Parvibaculum sp.]MDP1628272.1 hypothetical protein [Parvibaculum sp.]MDP2150009.1 hypothetical protein [Parvibaculum sp.]MDP3330300.1 hypothetical protein [Parvibaculum sp.]